MSSVMREVAPAESDVVGILHLFVRPTADRMLARCDPRVERVSSRLSSGIVGLDIGVRLRIQSDVGFESDEGALLPEPIGLVS